MSDTSPGITSIIPSYLYQEYADDDDLLALVQAYNIIGQYYLNWFNTIDLPIYTGPNVAGVLLDWVAEGLYGIYRPALPSGKAQLIGPFNTGRFDQLQFNERKLVGSSDYYATSDDTFRRIITWAFFKGDGKVFNIRWLKRRIMRFLLGANGVNVNVDQTYQVSVTFGIGNQVNITILNGIRAITGGALFNLCGFNTAAFGAIKTVFTPLAPLVEAPILKAAIEAGVCELPFQFSYVIAISG